MIWIYSNKITCPNCSWTGESWGQEFTKDENGKIYDKCPNCGTLIDEQLSSEENDKE